MLWCHTLQATLEDACSALMLLLQQTVRRVNDAAQSEQSRIQFEIIAESQKNKQKKKFNLRNHLISLIFDCSLNVAALIIHAPKLCDRLPARWEQSQQSSLELDSAGASCTPVYTGRWAHWAELVHSTPNGRSRPLSKRRPCEMVTKKHWASQPPQSLSNRWSTYRWAWQWEEPCFLVWPAKFELRPTGCKLSLWSCERGLCTGSRWRAAGRGLRRKTQVAHWTRCRPAALPLFQLVALGGKSRTWCAVKAKIMYFNNSSFLLDI